MSLFSKRHYDAIAQVIRKEIEMAQREADNADRYNKVEQDYYHAGVTDALSNIRQALANLFHHDNPAFNADRFLKASGSPNDQ